ncbi:hypothetical protein [uncultured Aquimarina sp.]|uniref:hypothetical protein n=1 Tax=uncultured Aquimarina sp. TaxID=575652 RepID=UPI0026209764|nr:hypothetical protein [uncultured Aquimarina sp.]
MKKSIRRVHAFSLFSCGFLTLLMSKTIPVQGGGVSLIFVLTIPFFIIVGGIFGIISFYGLKNRKRKNIRILLLLYFYLSLLIGTILMFPFK